MVKKSKLFGYLLLTGLVTVVGFVVPQILPGVSPSLGNIKDLFSLSFGLTFMILGLMFSLIIDVWMQEKAEETLPVEVIQGERDLKNMYKSLREGACEMKAVWCSKYAEVDKYFKEEMDDLNNNPAFTIKRLINKDIVETDLQKHLSATQSLRASGRYAVKSTHLTEMECVVCRYEIKGQNEWKALLVFNDTKENTPVLGILFDPTKRYRSQPALSAIGSWFDKEWNKGGKI